MVQGHPQTSRAGFESPDAGSDHSQTDPLLAFFPSKWALVFLYLHSLMILYPRTIFPSGREPVARPGFSGSLGLAWRLASTPNPDSRSNVNESLTRIQDDEHINLYIQHLVKEESDGIKAIFKRTVENKKQLIKKKGKGSAVRDASLEAGVSQEQGQERERREVNIKNLENYIMMANWTI